MRVAVVGLGAIGSMALWRLAERDVDVHGYERFGAGHDHGAAAGETRRFSVQSQGDPRFTPLAVDALALWGELADRSDTELFRQTGGVIIGPEGTPAITAAVASASAQGLPHQVLDANVLRSQYPQHTVRATDVGVVDPLAGYLRPEAAVRSAIGRAEALGATVRLDTEVLAVEPRPDGVAVVTATGEQLCQRVVFAPGAWAGGLTPAGSVVPRRLLQAWYLARPASDYTPEVFPVFERVGDVSAYGFPSLDGVSVKVGIKFGPHPVVPDLRDVDRSVPAGYLRRAGGVIRAFFPGLYPDPARLQTGVEGYSADGRPYVGLSPTDERMVITCGFSGSGFKFAPVMGEIAADLATTGKTARDVDFLSPGR